MSTPSQPPPPPAGDGPHVVTTGTSPVEPPFEERLRQFWEKYRGLIFGVCAAILLAIVGRSVWEMLQARRAAATAAEYAAATSSEQLRSFAAEHAGDRLAGVARLRLADEAYGAGRFSEAAGSYQAALDELEDSVLAARARLGATMARMKSGDEAAARPELESIANDVGLPKPIRAEAAYHLASLATGAGQAEEANRLIEQINAIDPASLWAQRAMTLQQSLPTPAAPPAEADADAPAVSFPSSNP